MHSPYMPLHRGTNTDIGSRADDGRWDMMPILVKKNLLLNDILMLQTADIGTVQSFQYKDTVLSIWECHKMILLSSFLRGVAHIYRCDETF